MERKGMLVVAMLILLLAGCIGAQQKEETGAPQMENITPPPQEIPQQAQMNETASSEPQENESWGAAGETNETMMGLQNLTVDTTEIEENKTEKEYSGIEFDGYVLLLEDLSDELPYPCALVRVVEISGEEIEEYSRAKICPGESYYWTSPEGHRYRFYAVQTASGYYAGATWAEIIIYG